MKRRAAAIILAVVLCVFCCGCDMFSSNTENLLYPPQLTGEMRPIVQALKDSVDGEFTLKYPTVGEQRSAIVFEDVDNDGLKDAFAFYSTSNDDLTTMHINCIRGEGEEWSSVADESIIASGFEKVEFADLNNDGIEEIIVGWEIYAQSEKRVTVYSLEKNTLNARLVQPYTSFLCCDLNSCGTNELFIHLLDTASGINTASLYDVTDKGVTQIAGCIMDKKVSEAKKPQLSALSDGTPAIYIDEIKGVAAVTEVLFVKNEQLSNSLLDTASTMENLVTVRPAGIFCRDVDGDGALEIPVALDLPNANTQSTEKLYYTSWCGFDGKTLNQKDVTIINTADGYSLDVPQKWVGNIAVSKNLENRTRSIYTFDSENLQTGVKLVVYKAIPEKDWNKKGYDKENFVEICRSGETVFCLSLTAYDGEFAIDEQTAINIFSLTS